MKNIYAQIGEEYVDITSYYLNTDSRFKRVSSDCTLAPAPFLKWPIGSIPNPCETCSALSFKSVIANWNNKSVISNWSSK